MPSALFSLLNVLPSGAMMCAFGVSVLSVPLLRFLVLRSKPEPAIPSVGGVAFCLSVVAAALWTGTSVPLDIAVGLLVVWVIGMMDDRNALSPRGKTTALFLGLGLHAWLGEGAGLFDSPILDRAVQVLWLLWMCNAFNVLDAVDGLSAGVGALLLTTFGLLLDPEGSLSLICFSLAAALAGYLVHNFHPARVYMGDSGSLTIGFLLGTAAIHLRSEGAEVVVPALLVAVPCFEAFFLIVIRIAKVTSPSVSTYDHPTQRLIVSGGTTKGAVLTLYALTASLCGLALLSPGLLLPSVAASIGGFLFVLLVWRIARVDTAGDGVDARPGSVWDKTWLVSRLVYRSMTTLSQSVRGVLVDVGCGDRPYERLFAPHVDRYVGVDVDASRYRHTLDAVTRSQAMGLESECADVVLSNQVLEHVMDPMATVSEMARVLKPGGKLVLSAPHIWGIHEEPHDYFRFTPFGLRHLAERAGLTVISVDALAGYWVTTGVRFCYYLERFARGPLRPVVGFLNYAIQACAFIADTLDRRESDAWNHVLVAMKPIIDESKTGARS